MKIMCDSTCDLTLNYIEENDLHLFSILISLGEEEYRDIYDLSTNKIYESIAKGIHPKTSQVSVAEFLQVFTELAKNDESGIYISISSQLSGTFQTATLAAEAVKRDYPNADIRVIDSKSASIGIGVQVMEAVNMKNDGKTMDEIDARMRFMADNLVTLFTLSDLNYVAEGGRISKTAASIGSLLQINPVMRLIDGAVEVTEKIRGKKRLLKRLMEIFHTESDQIEDQIIGVGYSEDPAAGEQLLEALKENFQPKEILYRPIGSSIASHAGLGTLGIAYLKKTDA